MLTTDTAVQVEGSAVLEADLEVDVVGITDYEGGPALPAFTSEAALLHWQPGGSPYLELKGRVVVEMLLQGDWDRIVIDTKSADAYEITRSDAAELLGT